MALASPVQSALLDSKARLAWSGPWAVWSSSRPTSAAASDASWSSECRHTGLALASVKAPLWSSTLAEQPLTVTQTEAATVLERPVSQSGLRSGHGHGHRAGLSSASKAPNARSWSSPLLVNKVVEPTGVSSVETTLENFRRQRLLTQDFILQRGDTNLTPKEAEAQGDSGLYELLLNHGPSARNKAKRKRPLMKSIKEDHPVLDPRGKRTSTISGKCHDRNFAKTGRKSIKEIQELCGLMQHEAVEQRRRILHPETNADSRLHRRQAMSVSNTVNQQQVAQLAVQKAIEAKFKDEIYYSQVPFAGKNDEELSQKFGILIHELLEKYGSLSAAMQALDKSKKGRINRREWEMDLVKASHHKVDAVELGQIFAVLDKDHDGHLTFEEVLRFDPLTVMVTKDQLPLGNEAHARNTRHSKAPVQAGSVMFLDSSGRASFFAQMQEMERKGQRSSVRKDFRQEHSNVLQDFARNYRESTRSSKPVTFAAQADVSSSSDTDDDDDDDEEPPRLPQRRSAAALPEKRASAMRVGVR